MQETDKAGREWVITAACFTLHFCSAPFYVLTVFFTSLEADFGWSRALISSMHSTFLLVAAASNIIVGWLTDKYGPRVPLIACGLLIGIGLVLISQVQNIGQVLSFYALASLGAAAIAVVPMATVQRLVRSKRGGLALGITTAGNSAGRLFLTPVSGLLLLAYGWRTAYVVIGVAAWLLISFSAILLPSYRKQRLETAGNAPQHEPVPDNARIVTGSHLSEAQKQKSIKEIIKTKAFLLTCIMFMFPIACNQMIAVHIVPFAEGEGISKAAAATAFGLMGIFGIAGNIICSTLSGRISWGWLTFITSVGSSLAVFWLMGTGSLWMLYVFVVFYGFFFFGNVPTRLGFTRQLFGDQYLASTIAILFSAGALLGMFTTVAAGYIYDVTGSYSISFLIAAIFFIISAFTVIMLRRMQLSRSSGAL
ncbi:nitrate/nitrite transporter [Chloroflexota bacterium]